MKENITYIMAGLGILINFLSKYNARRVRKGFSLRFWIKDNWIETVQSVAFIFALMVMINEAEFDNKTFYDWLMSFILLPKGVVIPGELIAPFVIGLTINHIVYWYNKRFLKRR